MGDPSTVFRCKAAGSILVLYQSSIILYTLIHIKEIAAPESFRALNLFPAWTVTMGQSETRNIVNWLVDDCPPHSFESSSLLEEGFSSSKDQSNYLILRKRPIANPEW